MQYRDGNKANKNTNNIKLIDSLIIPVKSADKKQEDIIKIRSVDPNFLIFLPWLVVNSIFSLSKIRSEFFATKNIDPTGVSQKSIPPNGCGMILPSNKPENRLTENIKFQKLSLFHLALKKLVIEIIQSFKKVYIKKYHISSLYRRQNILPSKFLDGGKQNLCYSIYMYIH